MGWFSNLANQISDTWSGAKQFVSDVYGKVKDVGNGIKSGFDWVGNAIDKASNAASSIPYIGGVVQGALDEFKIPFNAIAGEVNTINDQIQNPSYAHLGQQLGDFGDYVVGGLQTGGKMIDAAFGG